MGARSSTQSTQRANGKTGALRGPETWLERERKDGDESGDDKREHESEDDKRKHEGEDER